MKLKTFVAIALIASSCHSLAGIAEGKAAYEANDYKTALVEFTKDQKDPDAMAWIGFLYQEGNGVKKNPQTAAKWMEKAAKAGQAWAAARLAQYYIDGSGVKGDPHLAFEWEKKAVDGGETDSVSTLGRMYLQAYGTAKDGEKAVQLFKLGADKGDVDSMQELGWQYYSGEFLEKDFANARTWMEKAVNGGSEYAAAFGLGLIYMNGEGVPKDPQKAITYYKLAAEKGHPGAQNNLGLAYWHGNGVYKNLDLAEKWLKLASDNGEKKGVSNYTQFQNEKKQAQATAETEAAAQERRAYAKRAPGTRLCNRGSGQYQEFQGIYVLGKPYFKTVNGSYNIMAFVERAAPPKLSLRVARIDFTTVDRRSVNLTNWDDPNWGQLSPGSIFWSDEYVWDPC